MPRSGIFSTEKRYGFYQKAAYFLPAGGIFSTKKRLGIIPESGIKSTARSLLRVAWIADNALDRSELITYYEAVPFPRMLVRSAGWYPMLKRVKIQGYKSLADVEVELQPLTVLFGPNAAGKSNFLDALQLLSKIATSENIRHAFEFPYRGLPLESFTFGPEGIQSLLKQEKVSFSIEVDVELAQSLIDELNSQIQETEKLLQETNETGMVKERSITGSYLDIAPVQEKNLRYRIEIEAFPGRGTLRIAGEALKVLDAGNQILTERMTSGPSDVSFFSLLTYRASFPYIEALRRELAGWFFFYLEPRERMRLPAPIKDVRHVGSMGEDIAAFFNTLQALDEPQFKAIEKALHMFIPSITGIDISINNRGEIDLRLMQGQTPVPVSVVSEGTLRVLALLALSGIQERTSLIGFEEPETGVYPERIDLIVSLLRTRVYSDTQMIVTTHSPELLDLLPRESLYICRKRQGRTSIEPFSLWELPHADEVQDDEEEDRRTVSERLLRGDFNA